MPRTNILCKEDRRAKFAVCSILVALIVLGWIIQGVSGLERTLLNQRHYWDLLDDLAVYPQLRAQLLQRFGEGWGEGSIADDTVISNAVAVAVSEAWVQKQAETLIDETLLFLKGQRQQLLLVIDLQERESIFRAALLDGFLTQTPPRLDQPELTEALLREFIDQIDLPDQVVLMSLTQDELPAQSRLVLGLIQFYRASLNFLPYVLGLLLVVLCLLWAGIVNGLKLLGIAVICSALSFLLLAKVAEVIIFLPLARSWGGSEILALLFNDGPTVLSSAVGITVTELIKVSLVYGTAGCVLLTAGLAAGMVRRRSGSVK